MVRIKKPALEKWEIGREKAKSRQEGIHADKLNVTERQMGNCTQ